MSVHPHRSRWLSLVTATILGAGVALALPAGQGVPRSDGSPRGSAGDGLSLSTPDDRQRLLDQLRENLWRDRELEERYTYLEQRRDIRIGKLGKVRLGPVRTFEVYPSLTPGRTYKRLIAVDGTPLPPGELARRDAEHRSNVLWEKQRRDSETPAQRAERERHDAQRMARQRRELEEAFAVFDIASLGHDTSGAPGRRWLRLSLTPRRHAPASSALVKYLKRLRGEAWVDEAAIQLVKVELEAIDDLTVGWGLLGRVRRGSRASYERQQVEDVWLPARARLQAGGRTLLVRPFSVETEWSWTDFRKVSVGTSLIGARPL
jgi:hypothetical protein